MCPEKPSGERMPIAEMPAHLEGGERGINAIFNLQMTFDMEGLYWFDIYLDEPYEQATLLTRIPLRIIYQPQPQRVLGPGGPR